MNSIKIDNFQLKNYLQHCDKMFEDVFKPMLYTVLIFNVK
jgi:hypothetical protein